VGVAGIILGFGGKLNVSDEPIFYRGIPAEMKSGPLSLPAGAYNEKIDPRLFQRKTDNCLIEDAPE